MTSVVFSFVAMPASVGSNQAVMRGGCHGLQPPMRRSEKGKPVALKVGSYSPQTRPSSSSPHSHPCQSGRSSVLGLCPPGVTRAETESQTLRHCWPPVGALGLPMRL